MSNPRIIPWKALSISRTNISHRLLFISLDKTYQIYIYNVLFVSGTVVEITLGPLPPLLCTCWTYDGFFSLEYPTRAHEPLWSRKPRSRPPILVRASKAGLRYLEPSSWTAIRIILLKWKNKLWKCSKNFTRQRWACQWNCIVSMR